MLGEEGLPSSASLSMPGRVHRNPSGDVATPVRITLILRTPRHTCCAGEGEGGVIQVLVGSCVVHIPALFIVPDEAADHRVAENVTVPSLRGAS